METIYWTCGGVANMINIISVKLNSFFLGSHNSQEVTRIIMKNTKNCGLLKKKKKEKKNDL